MRSEPFADSELTRDRFLGGRLLIAQPRSGYRAATDPVLLAAAAPVRPAETVLELGCGAGVASLCLGARVAALRLSGVDVQPAYAALARENALANGIAFQVHDGDISRLPSALRQESFDHVLANPPFFAAESGTAARDAGRERAQREETPLGTWIATGMRRLRPGGWLTLIQRAERLPDVLKAIAGGSITVLPVAARAGREAGRVIVLVRKGGRTPFRMVAPLVLHEGPAHVRDGDDYSAEASAILRGGQAIDLGLR